MAYKKRITLFAAAIFAHICVFSQSVITSANAESNQGLMRSEGKIYVAMTVAVTILLGLILFVWRLDRKINKLEQKEGNE